jgi:hypothetical protein
MHYEWDIHRLVEQKAKKRGASITIVAILLLLYFRF